jgi:hypothetical protein
MKSISVPEVQKMQANNVSAPWCLRWSSARQARVAHVGVDLAGLARVDKKARPGEPETVEEPRPEVLRES